MLPDKLDTSFLYLVENREHKSKSNEEESEKSNLVAGSENQKEDPSLDTVRKVPIPVKTSTAMKEQKFILSEQEDDSNEEDETNHLVRVALY